MHKIIERIELAKEIIQIKVEAPQIAQKAKPGQFVAVVLDERGERVPLTIADWDKDSITLIFQKVGFTTQKLADLKPGDFIAHILGPLGHPTKVDNFGTVVCIGGGVGIAEVYPVSRAFKEAGNRVLGIIGSRTKDLIILESRMKSVCDELFVTTDDGTYGKKGLVVDVLRGLLDVVEKSTHTKYPELVYAIGPVLMMKAVADLTREYKIRTIVSVNPIMVDATGMCGSCRCTVEGKTVFGCVDGPDFDAHTLDFDELLKRTKLFKTQEQKADGKKPS
ncbi:MAG: sulfide/dihydroorotate dehydrogenase-like FAD/NAD-binding protein [Candidatus Omnitrophica bacterium]|nr:sulfide/dihydroorotate dehydrogenase-like FAD/NAD-binding protein [Candidatus Omnitrophota bacterium]